MGNPDSVTKALAVYDVMQQMAFTQVQDYFTRDEIFFTDVQAEGAQWPTEYAIIKQLNTSLEPATVSGNKRRQLASLIIEANVDAGKTQDGRTLQLKMTHAFSAESLSHHDVVIDSITSNEYTNTRGAKFVTVIDFNYFVRV